MLRKRKDSNREETSESSPNAEKPDAMIDDESYLPPGLRLDYNSNSSPTRLPSSRLMETNYDENESDDIHDDDGVKDDKSVLNSKINMLLDDGNDHDTSTHESMEVSLVERSLQGDFERIQNEGSSNSSEDAPSTGALVYEDVNNKNHALDKLSELSEPSEIMGGTFPHQEEEEERLVKQPPDIQVKADVAAQDEAVITMDESKTPSEHMKQMVSENDEDNPFQDELGTTTEEHNTIRKGADMLKQIIPEPVYSSTSASDSDNSHENVKENIESNTNAISMKQEPQRSILRTKPLSPLMSDDTKTGSHLLSPSPTEGNGSLRKMVSFADENGGTIHKQHTITVSPNKLTRRVKRNKSPPLSIDKEDKHSGRHKDDVMGRVLVLLMDPPTKQYELTSLPYPLVSNDNGVVGPTQLSLLIDMISTSASYEPLKNKKYVGFCRPGEGILLSGDRTVLDHSLSKDEVLVAVPEGCSAEESVGLAIPILEDKRLVRLLKKLRKHERRAEKRRRLARKSMKRSSNEDYHGNSVNKHTKLEHPTSIGSDREGLNGSFVSGISSLLLAVLFLGIIFLRSKNDESLKGKVSMERHRTCLGRGSFCKPFGVPAPENHKGKIKWLQEISQWKLEGDDLMM